VPLLLDPNASLELPVERGQKRRYENEAGEEGDEDIDNDEDGDYDEDANE